MIINFVDTRRTVKAADLSFEYKLYQLDSPLFPPRLFVRWLVEITVLLSRFNSRR